MKKIYLSVLLLAFCAQLSCAASFDCAKASTATEKLICSDEKVSALDAQLGMAYKAASETAADKDAFKTQQRDWLKQKRNACTDADCLAQAYQARIDALTKISLGENGISASTSNSQASTPIASSKKPVRIREGGEFPLCNAIFNLFAVKNKAKELSQSVEPLLAIKGVTLPEWKEIPYEEYFSILNPTYPKDEKLKKFYDDFIKKYPHVKSYRTKINYDSEGADEYAIKVESDEGDGLSPVFNVLQDEHTLYKHYEYPQSYRLFFYKGETYFIGASMRSIGVYKPERFDEKTIIFSMPTICNIE